MEDDKVVRFWGGGSLGAGDLDLFGAKVPQNGSLKVRGGSMGPATPPMICFLSFKESKLFVCCLPLVLGSLRCSFLDQFFSIRSFWPFKFRSLRGFLFGLLGMPRGGASSFVFLLKLRCLERQNPLLRGFCLSFPVSLGDSHLLRPGHRHGLFPQGSTRCDFGGRFVFFCVV